MSICKKNVLTESSTTINIIPSTTTYPIIICPEDMENYNGIEWRISIYIRRDRREMGHAMKSF